MAQISGYITTLELRSVPYVFFAERPRIRVAAVCFFIDAEGVGSVMKSPIFIFYSLYGSFGVSYIKSYSCGRSVRLWTIEY